MLENKTAGTGALGLTDIYYVLFKHKWKILVLACAGLLAAGFVYRFWPHTLYRSEAKLFIRYIQESGAPLAVADDAQIKSVDQRGETIISSELEILTSMDLAKQVAMTVGPERVLEAFGGGSDIDAAAGAIRQGLTAQARRGSRVVTIAFEHPDQSVVQPVLAMLVSEYFKKHREIHMTTGLFDDMLLKETELLRAHLAQTEEELRQVKERAGVVSLEETKRAYAEQISKVRQQVLDTIGDLAEREAMLKAFEGSVLPTEAVPAIKAQDYRAAVGALETLEQKYQQLFTTFTAESAVIVNLRRRIAENTAIKERLETEYPVLTARHSATSSSGTKFNAEEERSRLLALTTRLKVLDEHLARIRKEANELGALEMSITDLERRKDLQESQYRYFSSSLEKTRINEALGTGRVSNISTIQAPTPPTRNIGGLYKVVGGLAVGGLMLGLGLAFSMELFLDQTVRRPLEIETLLGLPLFFSIPNIPGRLGNGRVPVARLTAGAGDDDPGEHPAPGDGTLNSYLDALRDRLIFFFDIRGVVKKPKLVAVTSCNSGAGASTIAAGLAASLSKSGEGNVLLVDMNMEQQAPLHFRNGTPQVGLDQFLEGQHREDAMVDNNLYVVPHATGNDRLSRILPKRFIDMIPRLRASDYDYIIFDMPAVNHVSVTPQLARFMDMVFLVVESEKTNRDTVKRAGSLLNQASCTLSVIVNRTRNYLPRALMAEV
jgi:uncharacterized protein involved in exopolysaccharide biosynthesis/Mrp family chromosome partitioning ATPase